MRPELVDMRSRLRPGFQPPASRKPAGRSPGPDLQILEFGSIQLYVISTIGPTSETGVLTDTTVLRSGLAGQPEPPFFQES